MNEKAFSISYPPAKEIVSAEESGDVVAKITRHLRQHPFDLLDARRLMGRFHASASSVRQALQQFETIAVPTQTRITIRLDELEAPTKKFIFSLLRQPQDLVDVRRLMRRYGVSSQQVHQALDWIAQQVVDGDEVEVAENLASS